MAKRQKKASRKRNITKKKIASRKKPSKRTKKQIEQEEEELEEELDEETENEDEGEEESRSFGFTSRHNNEEDDTDDEEDPETDEEDDEEVTAALSQGESILDSDIFTDVGAKFQKKGVHVYYTIYHNNQLLPPQQHPCSYGQLQKEYGGGMYRVVAKNAESHQYIKQETKSLAGPATNPFSIPRTPEPEEKEETQTRSGTQNLGMLDFLSLLQQERSGAKAELRELSRSQGDSQNTLMTMMIQMMQNSQNQSTQMMSQLQQSQMEMYKEMRASQDKMFMQMQTQMEKISEKSKANKEYSPFELMAKVEDAKTRGIEFFKKIQDELEERMDEKSELRAEIEKLRHETTHSKSSIDKIIELMIPAVLAAANKGGIPQLPQEVARPNSQPRPLQPIDSPRRSPVIQPGGRAPGASRSLVGPSQRGTNLSGTLPKTPLQGQVLPRAQTPRPANGKAPTELAGKEQSVEVAPNEAQVMHDSQTLEKGVHGNRLDASRGAQVMHSSQTLEKGVHGNRLDASRGAQVMHSSQTLEKEEPLVSDRKEKVVNLLASHVGQSLVARKKAPQAAQEAISLLVNNQFSPEEAIHLISEAELINIAHSYKIPSMADPWLKEFYGHIQNSTIPLAD